MKTTYTKLILQEGLLLDAVPDYEGRHELVRVEHPLLAKPLIVAAYASPKALPWKEAIAEADNLTVYDLPMRAPTVEEAFLFCDRSQYPCLPVAFFPDAEENRWTWTSTVDAEDPEDADDTAGYAWLVDLYYGDAYRDSQGDHYHVRAVRSGQ